MSTLPVNVIPSSSSSSQSISISSSSSSCSIVNPLPNTSTMFQSPSNSKSSLPTTNRTEDKTYQKKGKSSKSKSTPNTNLGKIRELNAVIRLDHNYCLPFDTLELNSHSSFKRSMKDFEIVSRFGPIKYLFNSEQNPDVMQMSTSRLEHLLKTSSKWGKDGFLYTPRSRGNYNSNYNYRDEDSVDIDVVSINTSPDSRFDADKSQLLMMETESHVNLIRPLTTPESENWSELVNKNDWTNVQHTLFNSLVSAFEDEHLARLAYNGNPVEPILRRNSLDLSSYKVRQALSGICWDTDLTKWIHRIMMDYLNRDYLIIYLDILQTLRAKTPALMDRMIGIKKDNEGPSEDPDGLHILIKRPWDPFCPGNLLDRKYTSTKVKSNPLFLFVPTGPSWSHPLNVRRNKNFITMVSHLGKVVTVTMSPEVSVCSLLSVDELAEKMITSSKSKLNETKAQIGERPIYLVGWGTGSIIAATVSLTEQVAGVICLGFPLFGISGNHGDGSDPLLQIKHPVLFVIGDRATNTTISAMEQFREELNNLEKDAHVVVIKGGDDYLRVGRHHRNRLLVTQHYIDKCIVEEIGNFVNDSTDPKISYKNSQESSSFRHSSESCTPKIKPTKLVNGEPMEGLGLALALSNGSQNPKTSSHRRKFSSSSLFEENRHFNPRDIEAFIDDARMRSHYSEQFQSFKNSLHSPIYPLVSNEVAAIQKAIALESAGSYSQYYSQYEASLRGQSTPKDCSLSKVKKTRKPRESKSKEEMGSKRSKTEILNRTYSGDSHSSNPQYTTKIAEVKVGEAKLDQDTAAAPSSEPSYQNPIQAEFMLTLGQEDIGNSPFKIFKFTETTDIPPRSPPMLIPTTQTSRNVRIPIRLCIQPTTGLESAGSSEKIEASLIRCSSLQEASNPSELPALVPVRSPSLNSPVAESATDEKLNENVKNLQIKIPRIPIPSSTISHTKSFQTENTDLQIEKCTIEENQEALVDDMTEFSVEDEGKVDHVSKIGEPESTINDSRESCLQRSKLDLEKVEMKCEQHKMETTSTIQNVVTGTKDLIEKDSTRDSDEQVEDSFPSKRSKRKRIPLLIESSSEQEEVQEEYEKEKDVEEEYTGFEAKTPRLRRNTRQYPFKDASHYKDKHRPSTPHKQSSSKVRVYESYSEDEEFASKRSLRSQKVHSKGESDKREHKKRRLPRKKNYPEDTWVETIETDEEEELLIPKRKQTRERPSFRSSKSEERRKTRATTGISDGKSIASSPSSTKLNRNEGKGSRRKKRSGGSEEESNEVASSLLRVTRSRTQRLPSASASSNKEIETEDADTEDSETEDDDGKRKLKPIFPVSPASLSATRTRKVNIPKFFAYGM